MNPNNFICPCGTSKSYSDCCEIIHIDVKMAKTPEMLMRSRYSAFVLAKVDYLMLSWHKSTRPIKEKKDLKAWTKSVSWVKLEVLSSNIDISNTNQGYVEFKAFYIENNKTECIHEHSKFIFENDQWFYLNGI